MKTYTSVAGQSIYDVCLQTYGTLDYLYKLMQDNGIAGLDVDVLGGQQFVWDDSLTIDQQVNDAFAATNTRYATSVSGNGSVFFSYNNGGKIIQPPSFPIYPPETSKTYQVVYSTYFTSSVDGTTTLTVNDINGQPIIGYDILQIENNIQPLKNTQYSWNKNTAQLSLLDGLTVDNGATLFILYSKIVTP